MVSCSTIKSLTLIYTNTPMSFVHFAPIHTERAKYSKFQKKKKLNIQSIRLNSIAWTMTMARDNRFLLRLSWTRRIIWRSLDSILSNKTRLGFQWLGKFRFYFNKNNEYKINNPCPSSYYNYYKKRKTLRTETWMYVLT